MELFERRKVPVITTSPDNGESCSSNTCNYNDEESRKFLSCKTKERLVVFHFGGKIMSVIAILQWLFNSLVLGPVQHLGRIFYQNLKRYGSKLNNGCKTSQVFVINSVPSCDRLIRFYRWKYPHKLNFLGVDCEWMSCKEQRNYPVALLQIATPLRVCFLIRLCKMDGRLPQSVREILEDRNILKFGVGIQDDSKKLRASYGVKVSGCVDLRHVVHRCRAQNRYTTQVVHVAMGTLSQNTWSIYLLNIVCETRAYCDLPQIRCMGVFFTNSDWLVLATPFWVVELTVQQLQCGGGGGGGAFKEVF